MLRGSELGLNLFLRHPKMARAMLCRYAPPLLYRLTIEPPRGPDPGPQCEVDVRWLQRPGTGVEVQSFVVINWSEAKSLDIQDPSFCLGVPPEDVTKDAAVGMMALLIAHLEQATVTNVLPIGTGADYCVVTAQGEFYRVEVSGLREARYPSDAKERLKQKYTQLLTRNEHGFISVTTFSYPPDGVVHSYLHFVRRQPGPETGRGEKAMRNVIDPTGEAAALSAEAGTALYRGDTKLAQEKHAAAGKILRACLKGAICPADRNLIQFLAATQYFKAGMYSRALKLAQRVEERLLPDHARPLFPDFLRQVRQRTKVSYASRIRQQVEHYRKLGQYHRAISLLQYHPYVIDRSGMAYLRACLCHWVGASYAAGIYIGAAYNFGITTPSHLMELASLPFAVLAERGPAAAWDAAREAARGFPHALTELVASAILYQLALTAQNDTREQWARKLLDYYRMGMEKYAVLSEVYRADTEIREFVVTLAGLAAVACGWLGDLVGVDAAIATAEATNPETPVARKSLAQMHALARSSPGQTRSGLDFRWSWDAANNRREKKLEEYCRSTKLAAA